MNKHILLLAVHMNCVCWITYFKDKTFNYMRACFVSYESDELADFVFNWKKSDFLSSVPLIYQ